MNHPASCYIKYIYIYTIARREACFAAYYYYYYDFYYKIRFRCFWWCATSEYNAYVRLGLCGCESTANAQPSRRANTQNYTKTMAPRDDDGWRHYNEVIVSAPMVWRRTPQQYDVLNIWAMSRPVWHGDVQGFTAGVLAGLWWWWWCYV